MTDAAPGPAAVSFPDRLEPAAALAGQVAHDLGNVLTVVIGNAEILAESPSADPALAMLAARIIRAAQRGATLVDRLDRFARHIPPSAGPADPAALVAAYAARLAPGLPAGVTLTEEIAPGLPPIALDAATLALALDELVENAVAALGGAGRLWLRAGPGASGWVAIAVADDGPGMTPDAMARCAAPSFGSGVAAHKTGLGLPIAARVAAAGGGKLVLAARPGGGTEARLELPEV
jgi:signal transduction histidine kinase